MVTTSTIAGTRVPRTIRRRLQAEWFSNTRADVLSGLVVALALIPEAIAFSIIAGVDPKVGLCASFSSAVIKRASSLVVASRLRRRGAPAL